MRACAGLTGASPAERLLLALRAHDLANAAETTAREAVPRVIAALDNGYLLGELGPDSPTYLQMSGSLQWMDELQAAEREFSSAVVEARRVGAVFGFAMATSQLGSIAFKRGELSRAEVHARTAAEVGVQMGWLAGFPIPLIYLIDVLNERGELAEADRLLITHGLTGSLPESHAFTEFLGARGRLRLSQGQLEQGIEDLHRIKELGYKILEAVSTGNYDRWGQLLDEHWQNKKKLSRKISLTSAIPHCLITRCYESLEYVIT